MSVAALALAGALAVGAEGVGAAGSITLTGAGATFPYPLYARWFAEYNRLHPEVRINYQPIGSGGGIAQVQKGTVDFGASDAPLSDQQLKEMGRPVLLLPTVAGSVAMIYHLPKIATGLKLVPENVADIYLGKITKWNDGNIAAKNAGARLPDMPITVVHRSDGSGTTFIFTSFLSEVSTAWSGKVGRGTSVEWPAGVGGKGSDGVAGIVKQTPGAIGYVEVAYAVQNRLAYAVLGNRVGQWIAPSLSATTAAAAAGAARIAQLNDVRASIAHSPAPDTYPIVGFTFLLLPQQQADEAKGRALAEFVWWAVHNGQKYAPQLLYAPLPPQIVAIDERIIRSLSHDGKALLP